MIFGNNIEQMGFEKSGWVIVDQSADGNTVYMGKPSTKDTKPADASWHIRKVVTEVQEDGSQITTTQYAEPEGKCVWADRKNLEYQPNFLDIRKFSLYIPIMNSEGDVDFQYKEYSFEYGMTWREWVDSEYNVDKYVIKNVLLQNFEKEDQVIIMGDVEYGGGYYIHYSRPEDLILPDGEFSKYDVWDYLPEGGWGGGWQ